MAKCGECELKNNLWLCLACGHLACGRKNYDGTGGNGHALEHFKSTNHSLVCKMGTITPEGTASVHCYACDNEVLDGNLKQHLASFGILVQNLVKTEKTIAEIELEYNINLTLSKAIEEGRILTPRYGPGYTGLENLGNSCYMNSILQTLFAIPEWVNKYNDERWLKTDEPANNVFAQIAKLAIALESGKYSVQKWTQPVEIEEGKFTESQEYQDGIRPQMFKNVIGKGHPEFSSPRQQDAYEYLQHLLTIVERQENANGTLGLSPTKIFDFTLRTKVKCLNCLKVRFSDNKQNSLSTMLPINLKDDSPDVVIPWSKIISNIIDPETIEFNCPFCKEKTPALKSYSLKSLPKVLILVINRFVCPDWVPKKLQCAIEVPTNEISLLSVAFTQTNEEILPEDGQTGPEINELLLSQLLDMGLSETQAKNGLIQTKNTSLEAAAS